MWTETEVQSRGGGVFLETGEVAGRGRGGRGGEGGAGRGGGGVGSMRGWPLTICSPWRHRAGRVKSVAVLE